MTAIIDKRIINLSSNHGTKLNGAINSNVLFYFQGLLRQEKDDFSNDTFNNTSN